MSEYLRNLVRGQLASKAAEVTSPSAHELPPEAWVRRFEAWTLSHAADDLPLLSDEDISRESIYRERDDASWHQHHSLPATDPLPE